MHVYAFLLQHLDTAAWLLLAALVIGLLLGRQLPRRTAARVKRPARKAKDSVEIYVGNLSYKVSEDDLAQEFSRFGKVRSARVIKNRFNGKSKGYGFVEMPEREEALKAIAGLNGKPLRGRDLVVNEAKSRSQNRQD